MQTAAIALLLAALPAHAETIAITNARIETVAAAGTIASGTIVLQDGRITALGPNLAPPAGARVIDAKGGTVTPGIIASSNNLMAAEVNLLSETREDGSGDHLSAGFDIQYGLNPAATAVPVARGTGVTRAIVTPLLGRASPVEQDDAESAAEAATLEGAGDGKTSGKAPSLFAGQAAVVRLDAGNNDPVQRGKVGMVLDLGDSGARHAGGSRSAAFLLVKAAFEEARRFARDTAAYEKAPESFSLGKLDLAALVPVVQGKTPLLVRASRASDLRLALRLAREERVRIILEGAEEGWLVASELAAAGVPVLLDPTASRPDSFESLGARLDNAARLHKAGVLVGILGGRNFNSVRPARVNAGLAVAYGLPRDEALAAVTRNVARIWGLADKTGTLEPGKEADLVLWSGDPLENMSYARTVFIAGVEQSLESRRRKLRDRYLKPDDGYPPAYH
jgi:imidazolonepropionase-like amidohydrolase